MIDPLPTFPISSASGIHLTLADGRRVIDGMSSWWAALHGYRHPELDEAIKRQVDDMSHVMFGGLTHQPAVELACRLLQMANNDYAEAEEGDDSLERLANNTIPYHFTKVFFADSGSISIEVALKMSIQYWFTLGQQKKTKFISLRNGYHGDSFGAMSICDPVGGMHSMFGGILAQQYFVKSPSGPREIDAMETLAELETMLRNHSHEVAAVVMEPIVQGAGGMKFYHPIVLRRAKELCDDYNVLLIFDEIATGFGRTGALFAGWHDEVSYRPWSSLHSVCNDEDERDECNKVENKSEVYPDIVCLGKALTGGYMTLGATLTTDKLAQGISGNGLPFMHGPTFMANPLASSVSLASLKLIQKTPWKERVSHVRNKLIQHLSPLADLSSVAEVRVLGAIGVCELKENLSREQMTLVQQTLVEEGVWLRPFGKLLYTMPPFNCGELEDEHLRAIGDAMYITASNV
jgi:adenosylmethionine-8-amino-7-oxononanoate aminotransferase